MKLVFLTKEFYDDYTYCTQILKKQNRPYMQVAIEINGICFAIPFRSNIKTRNNEYKALLGNEYFIKKGLMRYLKNI